MPSKYLTPSLRQMRADARVVKTLEKALNTLDALAKTDDLGNMDRGSFDKAYEILCRLQYKYRPVLCSVSAANGVKTRRNA